MKHSKHLLTGFQALVLAIAATVPFSCEKAPSESPKGTLRWNYSEFPPTRSLTEIPDTDSFILRITDAIGGVLYDGLYGDSPESLLVDPGSYTVRVVSREFDAPEFSAPQFGDERVALVQAGTDTRVVLNCAQLNSGLRFKLGDDFKEAFPEGSILVSSSKGDLAYSQDETRTGYFNPGSVVVSLKEGADQTRLLSRYLEAREILTLGITCPSPGEDPESPSGGISITVDTLRYWNSSTYVIGSGEGDPDGSSPDRAYSVPQAKEHAGEKGVWIKGYIVGGDLSSADNGISFLPPFESMTNIALASRSSVTDKNACVSVQLPTGKVREALNLVGNPGMLGKLVYVKGEIVETYFGIVGLKNSSDFSIAE